MINYYNEYKNVIKSLDKKPRLLLHSCCAPCSSTCLEELTKYFLVDVYFYNPNITLEEEFNKRLSEQIRFISEVYGDTVKVINAGHNSNDFYSKIKGLEDMPERGARCRVCYALRLDKTAEFAKLNGYDYFTTTLSISPHKNAEWINQIGEELESNYGVKFLYSDFKKQGGYIRSIELSKEYNLYRQDYCGCIFSRDKRRNTSFTA